MYAEMSGFTLEMINVAILGVQALPEDTPERSWTLYRLLNVYALTNARALPRGPITKWDAIHPVERASLDATPFGDGNKTCSGCGEPLPTEGAFARHFTVSDRRYLGLGSCPKDSTKVCAYCKRRIYWAGWNDCWDLIYREYADTKVCDARGDGTTLSTLPHEPEGIEVKAA